MSSKIYKKDKVIYPMEMNHLYKVDEIPEDLKGRGVIRRYGHVELFSPFSGLFYGDPNEYNWMCERCGYISFWSWIVDNDHKCLGCGVVSHKWRNGK